MELFNYMGFSDHPFEGKSAEKEIDFLTEIFIKPRYYNTLKSGLINGNSRFIIGERGHGKTAILLELEKALEKEKIFTIRIEEFDGVPETDNDKDLIKLIIEQIAIKLAVKMFTDGKSMNTLDRSDKEFLDIIYTYYFKVITKEEFEIIKNKVTPFRSKNKWKIFVNFFISILNAGGSAATFITAGMVREALGQPTFNDEVIVHQKKFIAELEQNKPSQLDIKKSEYWDFKKQKELLCNLAKIIKKIGFRQLVIFVDKLDEYPPVTSNVGKIKDFIKPILNDTSIFLSNDYAVSFSIWSKVQHLLESDGIRFDKVDVDVIKWSKEKMEEILDQRLKHFSTKGEIKFKDICRNEESRKKIIELSNGSPRDMILLLKRIYDEQNEENKFDSYIDEKFIQKGIGSFIEKYNFSAHSISENSKNKKSVKTDLNLALKIKQMRFDLQCVVQNTGLKNPNQANQLCERLADLQIIRELDEYKTGGHRQFEIIDPKIEYLIKIGRTSLN